MRCPLVAGNWKMNGSCQEVDALLRSLLAGLGEMPALRQSSGSSVEIAVFPPAIYIPLVKTCLEGTPVTFGGQNLNENESGAFTGEVSAAMLTDFGCSYVIVGHSERRSLFNESNVLVGKKCVMAMHHGLTPILCVGETRADRDSDKTFEVIETQLRSAVSVIGIQACHGIVVAYEPVWAIGTGLTATPEQVQAVHAFIRGVFAGYDAIVADKLRILYGGSVKPQNAEEIFEKQDVDGGLIGGASLDAGDFLKICAMATKTC